VAARWEKCLDPKLAKGAFTEEEDRAIVEYVKQNGACNWPALSQVLVQRSPKQCRERWCNHLRPGVSRVAWTVDEDALIFDNHERIGPKWSMIAHALPGRTDNAIKNRWNSSICKRILTHPNGRRSIVPEEDRKPRPSGRAHKPDRPPPVQTAEIPPVAQVVPVDLSLLQPWQLQVLRQFKIIEPQTPEQGNGQICQTADLTWPASFTSPQPESPNLPFTFAPESPFDHLQTLPTPEGIFTLDDGSRTPMSPGKGFNMNVFK
jgi:hypothetical protein